MNAASLWWGAALGLLYGSSCCVILRVSRREPAVLVLGFVPVVLVCGELLAFAVGAGVNLWSMAAAYCFFALCFLMAFGAIYKSLSLYILLEIRRTSGSGVEESALSELYIKRESFSDRLNILTEKGLAAPSLAGRWELSPRGRNVAVFVSGLQHLYCIRKSG